MLRAYRCERYAARLRELSRCLALPVQLDSVYDELAQTYADRTEPTPGECFARKDHLPAVLTSDMEPAPKSVWEEDAALASELLRRLHLRPTAPMALKLYTATLCRHAGMSVCEESKVAQRRALPEGKNLGDLMADFVVWDEDPLEEREEWEEGGLTGFYPEAIA